jgi:hypothetical protein
MQKESGKLWLCNSRCKNKAKGVESCRKSLGIDILAYREEAAGMLAAVTFLQNFVWFHCHDKAKCMVQS